MLATVGMAACSKDDTAPAAGPKKYVQVTIPEDMVSGETRTSIDGTTTNWVAGDKVAVLLYDGAATMTCQFTADKSGPDHDVLGRRAHRFLLAGGGLLPVRLQRHVRRREQDLQAHLGVGILHGQPGRL